MRRKSNKKKESTSSSESSSSPPPPPSIEITQPNVTTRNLASCDSTDSEKIPIIGSIGPLDIDAAQLLLFGEVLFINLFIYIILYFYIIFYY